MRDTSNRSKVASRALNRTSGSIVPVEKKVHQNTELSYSPTLNSLNISRQREKGSFQVITDTNITLIYIAAKRFIQL